VSERRAYRVVRQWRGTQRYLPLRRTDEDQLMQAILALAGKYGRYATGASRCCCRARGGQWERIECSGSGDARGLKVPQKQRASAATDAGSRPCHSAKRAILSWAATVSWLMRAAVACTPTITQLRLSPR
jgi:hypothetical protein